jgi:hypothetical protein
MIDEYLAVGGMIIGRGNQSTWKKPAPVPLCPPQIPHNLTWDRTRAAAVGSQRLTAWAMAQPLSHKIELFEPNLTYPMAGNMLWNVTPSSLIAVYWRFGGRTSCISRVWSSVKFDHTTRRHTLIVVTAVTISNILLYRTRFSGAFRMATYAEGQNLNLFHFRFHYSPPRCNSFRARRSCAP